MTGRQENYSSENRDKTKASNAWGILKSLMLIKKLACLLFMVLVGCARGRVHLLFWQISGERHTMVGLIRWTVIKQTKTNNARHWSTGNASKCLFCAISSPRILSPCCSQEKRSCYWLEMASIVSATLFPPTAMFHKKRLAVGGRGQDRGIQNADFDFVCFVECKQSSGRYLLKNWR